MIVEFNYDSELDQEIVDTLNALESAGEGLIKVVCQSKVQYVQETV